MSALHWICALTLTLVYCLSAQPVKRSTTKEKEIPTFLNNFREVAKNKCPKDTRIYSPTDIRGDCLSSALNCTQLELNVLKEECNLTKDLNDLNDWLNLNTGLDYAMSVIPESPSSCSCESYNETDVQQFLDALQTLVQRWSVEVNLLRTTPASKS
ncbi:hypothetical protein F2P79_019792 [Pimephales promelas]|nr:hypothetical protein F2P79_019792 [Pimephales promelas]